MKCVAEDLTSPTCARVSVCELRVRARSESEALSRRVAQAACRYIDPSDNVFAAFPICCSQTTHPGLIVTERQDVQKQLRQRLGHLVRPRNTCRWKQYKWLTATGSSPQGRIFQVEYAQEAVKQGSVVVGIVSKTHAVLAALKVYFTSA